MIDGKIQKDLNSADSQQKRPLILEYDSSQKYFRDQIRYLKSTERNFSLPQRCKKLRKISPTLVTLIIQGKRRITLDRIDEVSELLKISGTEKIYLKRIIQIENSDPKNKILNLTSKPIFSGITPRNKLSESILNQPLYLYVKDAFQIPEVQNDHHKIYGHLSFIASPEKINKAIQFLLREGYLRKTVDNKIVIENPLSIAEPLEPHLKVRNIHKKSLKVTHASLDLIEMQERLANLFIIPLSNENKTELIKMINEFSEKIKAFSEVQSLEGQRLYQLIIHLNPTGVSK